MEKQLRRSMVTYSFLACTAWSWRWSANLAVTFYRSGVPHAIFVLLHLSVLHTNLKLAYS